ncbi:MAG: hypothetical protein ACYC6O_10510 [Thermoleophilia bacterium]
MILSLTGALAARPSNGSASTESSVTARSSDGITSAGSSVTASPANRTASAGSSVTVTLTVANDLGVSLDGKTSRNDAIRIGDATTGMVSYVILDH